MIDFNYETNFQLESEEKTSKWIQSCIEEEGFELGEVNYIFCDDSYLHKINVEFLQHDTFTDIISFDYTLGKLVGGDIFISIERVKENADLFKTSFENELHRVIIHGILHYMKYKDKTEEEKEIMRNKENDCLKKLENN
ncbi:MULTISPECIES: rRNA maturation RNase YbeY [unclassified Tenacibaculum]|uniref:rRNA maturation RNase YbeY n=1 Tax=Tenacibaculum TaxID=104267 RepID=UPI001F1ECD69|nr:MULTISPECIES: rRNA maturation RNase YbeY [unclassified Tenacibaculum]MCF2874824.1 rRNA maturation RNase YbeY [Tenacibaculum sp. Cn5-1]MCF2934110.1 rRNA maturation RNase YbeY [Tenacibaculum sp. Cn5-34]MCG7510320.1 rRNA maturation RNase YbeY [Tenacibaculum sp. Cn5-46]